MLRPLLAFLTLCLAAFLLAPTVASVHERVTDLDIDRETPWEIFKWTNEVTPDSPLPDCARDERYLVSEVKEYPAKIDKDEDFTIRGWVGVQDAGGEGVDDIEVDLWLNETKELPGELLGTTYTRMGYFQLEAEFPDRMAASHYHIVAHAKEKEDRCVRYHEHWSDPEMDVVSNTSFEWDEVEHAVVGREIEFTGRLVDVVGAGVDNANVTVTIGGKTQTVQTRDGGFRFTHTPTKAGNLTVKATFAGTAHYRPSSGEHAFPIAKEDVEIDDITDVVRFLRSEPRVVSGHVYVSPDAREETVTLAFDGFRVATCLECDPQESVTVPVDEAGAFSVELVVPPSEAPRDGTLTLSGGGLEDEHPFDARLEVQPVLALDAQGTSLFGKSFEATARLTDETGRPLAAPLTFRSPLGESNATTADDGTARFEGSTACGRYTTDVAFEGAQGYRDAEMADEMVVCTYLAILPPWMAGVPLWVWPLAIVLAAIAAYVAWSLRQTYAPVIRSGPALALRFTEPGDDALGYAAIGEGVVATAFLEDPLPSGHVLRMGTSRHTEEVELEADLRAHLHLVPEKLGDVNVRAEIVDAKGRVVSRRTATLHVVRYAEEIERRYLELRAAHGAAEAVTPREFERWLHERAPGLDPAVARRLIHVFEEADYSPRAAGRAEFSAYLQAESSVQEVSADARMA